MGSGLLMNPACQSEGSLSLRAEEETPVRDLDLSGDLSLSTAPHLSRHRHLTRQGWS